MATHRLSSTVVSMPVARTGGSRKPSAQVEAQEFIRSTTLHGSHMPLDSSINWSWRNPLNLLPALLLVLMLVGVFGSLISLFF